MIVDEFEDDRWDNRSSRYITPRNKLSDSSSVDDDDISSDDDDVKMVLQIYS